MMGVTVRVNGKERNTEGLIGCLDTAKGTLEYAVGESAWHKADLSDIHVEVGVFGDIREDE